MSLYMTSTVAIDDTTITKNSLNQLQVNTSYFPYKIAEIDISTNTTQVDITGLDGNSDEVYLLILRIYNPTGSQTVNSIRFNDVAINKYYRIFIDSNGSSVSTGETSVSNQIEILKADANSVGTAVCYVFAKSGSQRHVLAHSYTSSIHRHLFGRWVDTTSNLTKINIVCNTSNGIGTGSKIWVYKLVG